MFLLPNEIFPQSLDNAICTTHIFLHVLYSALAVLISITICFLYFLTVYFTVSYVLHDKNQSKWKEELISKSHNRYLDVSPKNMPIGEFAILNCPRSNAVNIQDIFLPHV